MLIFALSQGFFIHLSSNQSLSLEIAIESLLGFLCATHLLAMSYLLGVQTYTLLKSFQRSRVKL